MISKDLFKYMDALVEEKGITKEQAEEVVKQTLKQAFKKTYGHPYVEVELNEGKHEVKMSAKYIVVEEITEDTPEQKEAQILLEDAKKIKPSAKLGDKLSISVSPKDFGRGAASSGKQMLTQSIKQNQRSNSFAYYKSKEGEMVNAIVAQINDDFISIKIEGEAVASLPKKEKLPNDVFNVGDKIKVYLSKVEETPKGPKFYVSRNDKNLVKRLMEQYIPEIKEGTIEVVELARDAGDRCKVCVLSNNPNVDPIGACIGEKGARIASIVEALNGEKIDLYKYSDEPTELIKNSLQPSDVIAVINVSIKDKTSTAIVPDDQLSLAIGKHGQNVRLAVQSCGWKIDIKSESDATKLGLKF